MGNQGSLMIIPRGRVMVPGFHVMKFDTNQDGLQVRGQVILDVTSRSQERTDCNLCGVVNMDLETYTFHKKTQFHLENLGDHLLCHEEEGFVTPMGKCPPRTPPAPRRLREEEQVRDYPAVSLINARRELIDEEDAVSFSLSQELDEVAPAPTPVPTEPIVTITNANAEEVKDILRRAFVTDFFRTLRAQGNNGRNKKFLIEGAIETWHQYFSQYLVFENKKKLVFLLESVLKEYGKDFKFNKIENIGRALNYVIPRNGVLMAFHRNEEEVFTRKTLVSEKDFQEESATPETCHSEEEEEKTPDADSELFIVDDDDTIIDDEAFPEVDPFPEPIIPDAVVADPLIPEADEAIPDAVVTDPVIFDAVVADPVIPEAVVADPVIADAVVAENNEYYDAVVAENNEYYDAVVAENNEYYDAEQLRLEEDVAEQLLAVSEQLPVVTEPEYEDGVEVLPVVTEVIDAVDDYEEVEVLPVVDEVGAVEPEEEVLEGCHERYYHDGGIYDGNYVNNERSGFGQCIFPSDDDGIYKGHWFGDKRNGQGVMEFYNGDVYEGEWKNDHEDGKGKLIYKKGESYEGDYKDGWRHGQGLYRFKVNKRVKGDQRVSYEGEWKNNEADGFGKLTWSDGTVEEGFWVAGVKSKKRKAPSSVAPEVAPEVAPAWKIVKIKGDGNCTFRALAYLIYGDECYHLLLRRVCYETIFAEGKQHLLEEEEMNNWAIFGNEGGPKAIETIARLYGCQVNVIDSRKKTMSGNGPYNANDNHPVLTLVYSTGHYDAYSNGVFDFKSATFLDEHRATIGTFENRILQGKGGQIMPDQVLLSGSALQYENREYDILDVTYARSNWMTLPSKTLLDLPDGLIQHTQRNATVFKCFDNDKGYDTKKKPPAHQYLYYYKIGKDNWICGLLATPHRVQYIKRARRN